MNNTYNVVGIWESGYYGAQTFKIEAPSMRQARVIGLDLLRTHVRSLPNVPDWVADSKNTRIIGAHQL